MSEFVHLHVKSRYSPHQSNIDIFDLVRRAKGSDARRGQGSNPPRAQGSNARSAVRVRPNPAVIAYSPRPLCEWLPMFGVTQESSEDFPLIQYTEEGLEHAGVDRIAILASRKLQWIARNAGDQRPDMKASDPQSLEIAAAELGSREAARVFETIESLAPLLSLKAHYLARAWIEGRLSP